MSTKWKSRLANLTKTQDDGSQEAKNQYASLMQQISNVLVSMCPDPRLVEPCDTHPETCADIRETTDVADGRVIAQGRGVGWSTERARRPLDAATEQRMAEIARKLSAESLERIRRTDEAVTAARVRIGRLPTREATEIPPEPASS